jgi:heme-degrading monooxygenase HmoA
MTEIRIGDSPITMINIFTVAPDKADELVEMLDRATTEIMSRQKGFVSANIHKSLDGRKVANYAQWLTRHHFEQMMENPECQQHMNAVAKVAEKFEPSLYAVARVHEA